MGREIRRVPPDWQHPTNSRGHERPLHDRTFDEAIQQYRKDKAEWDAPGNETRREYEAKIGKACPFEDWGGDPPNPDYYRPAWPEGSDTAWQIYETVSEGTPISPVFTTREALIEYLTTDGGGMGIGGVPMRLSRQAAERFVEAAWSPSMTFTGGALLQNAQIYEIPPAAPSPGRGEGGGT